MAKREKRNRNRGSSGYNRKSSEDFLMENRQKKGIHETSSGLQYQILEKGEGPVPDERAHITIHQRCWLLNGKMIEDTYRENKPSEAEIHELIEGYREGVMLMNKGARYKFFIPSDLAWGKKGTGTKIPPNALLIFDVRLLDFW